MVDNPALTAVQIFVGLLAAAAFVAVLARRIAVPYSVALVVFGLAAAIFAPGIELDITEDLVLAVLLPGLIFDAAYRLDPIELRRSSGGVALLAVPGVAITALGVAAVLAVTGVMPFELGLVVGAMVSATDPAAVVATFREIRAPKRLSHVVEAESLFNDGTALVVFVIALRAVESQVSVLDGVAVFAATVVVSCIIGAIVGVIASRLIAAVGDHLIELTISVVAAYGAYLVADVIQESGIIATVVAGIVVGTYGRRIGISPQTQERLDTVWEFLAFLLTALIFLLVGLVITLPLLFEAAWPIACAIVAVLVLRAVVVYALFGGVTRLVGDRYLPDVPLSWLHVMFWAGLRGAVAVAMALALPADLPQRGLLQAVTFGVVLFTLLVQGTTAEPVVRRSGAVGEPHS